MKRLLVAPLLLTLLIASCSTKKKFNSYREANDACKEWAKKGGTYEVTNPRKVIPETNSFGVLLPERVLDKEIYKISLRWCENEPATNQVLGLRVSDIKENEKRIYIERCDYFCGEINSEDKKNSKVKANFNY